MSYKGSQHRSKVCERFGITVAELYDIADAHKPDSDRWWCTTDSHRMRQSGIDAVASYLLIQRYEQLEMFG